MKKVLIVSVILIVAGLGLILYSDPVILLASGGGPQGQIKNGGSPPTNRSNGGGPGETLPPGCQQQTSGGIVCTGNGAGPSGSITSAEIFTLSGIALCGVGLCLSGIEMISKSQSPYQTKAVT